MGGSGGSQGSGKVEYAAYLETAHSQMVGVSLITTDMKSVLNTMMGTSPYALASAFDPDTQLALIDAAIDKFSVTVDKLLDETDITADVDAFADILDDQIEQDIKPRYNALMRDIGAVQSSAYAIGFANIEASRTRDVAKYTSEVRLHRKGLQVQGGRDLLQITLDGKRTNIAAKHDQEQRDTELDVFDADWDITALLKGGQLLGSLGGGTVIPDKSSKLQSALGTGLAGAAAGAYVGGPVGAAVGGVIGLGVGAAFG